MADKRKLNISKNIHRLVTGPAGKPPAGPWAPALTEMGTPPLAGFCDRTCLQKSGRRLATGAAFEPSRGGGDDDLQILGWRRAGRGDDPGAWACGARFQRARFPVRRGANLTHHRWPH